MVGATVDTMITNTKSRVGLHGTPKALEEYFSMSRLQLLAQGQSGGSGKNQSIHESLVTLS